MDGMKFDPVGAIEGWEETEFGKYCFATDYDAALSKLAAETLRADTAEALRYKAELYDEVWADATGRGYMNVTMALCALTAAEQRVSELIELLKRIDRTPLDRWYREGLNAAVFAALNPKPEAGSK